ncbi:HAMP domain-containing protein [Salmonella enterica subsp. enterica]|nr:HAMP domain-containing protein [Salmonella enterica subsp. enterica]
MSSHPYVSQLNTPLDDDTTLMSTTDLESYITHANDTFVQVSGYQLNELLAQPHNLVRHPDMPKAAFADMWYTLKQGEPWSGIVKNRRKNGDHYWVRANAVPMIREGRVTGYMSIRTRATDDEIAAVEPLYQALNEGRCSKRIHKGLVVRQGLLGKLPAMPVRWRVRSIMGLMAVMLALALFGTDASWQALLLGALAMLAGTALFEWQIVRPIENVATQALKVATGERNSVQHLNRSDELGLTLRAVGQLGLMCRWLINDVSSQVSSLRNGSERLAKGNNDLNEHTRQTVENVQETVTTMNQMAESVKLNSETASAADELSRENSHDADSQKIINEIREARQQYLESRFRILKDIQSNNRQAAIQEMMTRTVQVQKVYKDKVQELIAVQDAQMHEASVQVKEDFKNNRTLLITLALISIAAGGVMGWYIVRSITRPLDDAVRFAEAIADGDLTRHITTDYKDETGVLLQALMAMKTRLLDIVQEVQNGSESISTAAAQIVAGNQDLAARTEEQASSVEETAASMEQITATVKNTADHTSEATKLSAGAASVVKNNGEMMNQVTQKMRVINDTANRMSDIINIIDSIAFQTNILALNAAVEAARAGEHGRGFAVVAGEVRQLAQKSASSASEIRNLIEDSTSQTQEGMHLVEKASALINGMVDNVEEMDVILREIGQASREQTDGISQINSAIGLIDAATQQNSCLVEESVAAAASLNEQALHLKELVNVFRVREEDTQPA